MAELAKPRQLMLVALSSTHAGEAFNALSLVKAALAKIGVDIHSFVDGMGGSSARADAHLLERVNRLERSMAALQVENATARRTIRSQSGRISDLVTENAQLRMQAQAQPSAAYAAGMANAPQGARARPGHQQMAAWLLANGFTWNQTTEAFLIDMQTWQYPTEKQQAWLDRLWEHHGPR